MPFEKHEAFCPYCGRKFLEFQPPKTEKVLVSHRCHKCQEFFSVYLKPVYVPIDDRNTPPKSPKKSQK